MAGRRDDLAKRLADRLDKAPPKGRAMSAGGSRSPAVERDPATPKPSAPKRPAPKPSAPKGTAQRRPSTKRAASKPAASKRAASSPDAASRLRRGSAGTVLRGHLVAASVHADARRRKAALRSERGVRVTWDDVMIEGVALLIGDTDGIDVTLDGTRRADSASERRRLVQATLPADLDQRLVETQLDLSEEPDRAATYEQLWTAAIVLWLRANE